MNVAKNFLGEDPLTPFQTQFFKILLSYYTHNSESPLFFLLFFQKFGAGENKYSVFTFPANKFFRLSMSWKKKR